MRWVFFEHDEYLASLDLDNKIKRFLESFETVFWDVILDELFIVKYTDEIITPLYYFCWNENCSCKEWHNEEEKIEAIKKRELEEFDFFVKNIISRMCILNNEWIIAKDQTWSLFDAVFRMDDYYIWLNNSQHSFTELKKRLDLNEDTFIKIVKNFYSELKK